MNKVPLSKIIPDTNQPRKYFDATKMASLKDSIKKQGIVNPIIVEKSGDKYTIIDGERRFRAAQELRLAEIPIIIVTSKDPIARLVEQFHIQEQHEPWSQSEKAQAIVDLAEQTGETIEKICEILSLPRRIARIYMAFGKLSHRDKFTEAGVSPSMAESIISMKLFTKTIKEKDLEESFSKAQENKLELALIKKMKEGEIIQTRDFTKIKDSFKMNPKLIDKFVGGSDESISDMFIKSKAKVAYHLRNAMASASYFTGHAEAFIKNPNTNLTKRDKENLKRARKLIDQLISMAGDDGE